MTPARVRIGTSGWTYDHWRGPFYPPDLSKARWRAHYVSVFDTVELNASFYRWPGEKPFRSWQANLPEGFTMSVKASRWLSHGYKLRDPEGTWAARLTTAVRALGDKAGPLLVQLPGDLERDDERLADFLGRMPPDVRVAMELRHPSWDHADVGSILDEHGAAYVITHGEGLHTALERASSSASPFVYLRWHGPPDQPLYAGRYSPAEIRRWAEHVEGWRAQGREVWGYFDNDGSGHAVANALELRELLGLEPYPQLRTA